MAVNPELSSFSYTLKAAPVAFFSFFFCSIAFSGVALAIAACICRAFAGFNSCNLFWRLLGVYNRLASGAFARPVRKTRIADVCVFVLVQSASALRANQNSIIGAHYFDLFYSPDLIAFPCYFPDIYRQRLHRCHCSFIVLYNGVALAHAP